MELIVAFCGNVHFVAMSIPLPPLAELVKTLVLPIVICVSAAVSTALLTVFADSASGIMLQAKTKPVKTRTVNRFFFILFPPKLFFFILSSKISISPVADLICYCKISARWYDLSNIEFKKPNIISKVEIDEVMSEKSNTSKTNSVIRKVKADDLRQEKQNLSSDYLYITALKGIFAIFVTFAGIMIFVLLYKRKGKEVVKAQP